jgi:three-Cys-motif partner protein
MWTAFAGSGLREINVRTDPDEAPTQRFLDGSARVALKLALPFDRYIFVEKDSSRCKRLQQLKIELTQLAARIEIENAEANSFIQGFCRRSWKHDRAVLFLDPFGAQIQWKTIKAIADTKAIDCGACFLWASALIAC